MKVTSPAGDFEITIISTDVEDNHIVIKGQMGVWDTKIFMKPSDVFAFLRIFLTPKVVWFLVKSPFSRILGNKE